jgi:hypothetical protein
MTEAAAQQVERRQDAGYIRRLIEDTHDCAEKTWKRMFEGNGEPAMIVQMAMIQAEQDRQREEMEKQRLLLDTQTKAMIVVQQTLLLITNAASKIGVALVIALVLGVVGLVWSMITHSATWFNP